jgi:hypothetical protein
MLPDGHRISTIGEVLKELLQRLIQALKKLNQKVK